MHVGDNNACIGKRETGDDVWYKFRGPHGIGTCTAAADYLLELCTVINL